LRVIERLTTDHSRAAQPSFLRLQPDLDQAADGFGAAGQIVLLPRTKTLFRGIRTDPIAWALFQKRLAA
jgi:hypothetical protein